MPFRLNQLGIFALTIYFVLSSFLCYGQGGVSKNSPNDTTEHILNLDINKLLHFNVSASDGKMSSIDAVSDSGSAWSSNGLETSTAVFLGGPYWGKAGTFKPRFSGIVRRTGGSGSGEPETYDWTAKAKYELPGEFQIEIEPKDFFIGYRNKLGIGEDAKVVVKSLEGRDDTVVFHHMEVTGINRNNSPTLININSQNFSVNWWSGEATIKVWACINDNEELANPQTIKVSVVEPNKVVLYRKNARPITRVEDSERLFGLAIDADIYVQPADVSFTALYAVFEKGGEIWHADGCITILNGHQHNTGQRIGTDVAIPNKGTHLKNQTHFIMPYLIIVQTMLEVCILIRNGNIQRVHLVLEVFHLQQQDMKDHSLLQAMGNGELL